MRNHCIVCGAPLMKNPLIECDRMPKSAQKFPDAEQIADDLPISLLLKQCSGCGLVQADVDPVPYYRDVIRSGGYSTTMHQLRHEQYQRFLDTCPMEGKTVIEAGCGRGEFLRIWREDGFRMKAYGIENDPELVRIAQEDGLEVWQDFAENEGVILPGGPFDGFCSFNYLEHQPDPNGMLRCLYANTRDEAYGLVTVPAWEYILGKESYYELIRDHIAYYSRESFCFLMEKNGFQVMSCRIVNRDTWEVIVRKRPRINTEAMKQNMDKLAVEMKTVISQAVAEGKKIAVWGASHQGLTILSSMELGDKISFVIDSAPFKQGKYAIGSHVPIVSPDYVKGNPVQAIIIVAPGYTEEIAAKIKTEYLWPVQLYTLRSNHIERIN